ncbi:MAG: hypothetical protein LBJ58_01820 [Tannerellaceae bacterium]|jgi:hypothetical protein|nr:hypothetical protein [Tannerellaceae bacterium]
MRLTVLILDIPLFHAGRRMAPGELCAVTQGLEPGDVLLVADKLFPLWQLLVKILCRSDYYHAAVYEGDGQVIEATTFHPSGKGVVRTEARQFFSGYKSCCVLRPPYPSERARRQALQYAAKQLGKPYDYALDADSVEAMYCTKLAAGVLRAGGIDCPPERCLWKTLFTSGNLMSIPGMRRIYGVRPRIAATLLLQLPFVLAVSTLSGRYALIVTVAYIMAGLVQYKFTQRAGYKLYYNDNKSTVV